MRFDNIGLFWDDTKAVRVSSAKAKKIAIPPDPVWLNDDYLPNLDESLAFKPDLFTDAELVEAAQRGEYLAFDIESYPNYWAIGFKSIQSGKCVYFESVEDDSGFDKQKLDWIARNFVLVDFNGEGYDRHILNVAIKPGTGSESMWTATERIIQYQEKGWQVAKAMGAKKVEINHIDLLELTPLAPSLKKMAGRLGSPFMMDLPFKPGSYLGANQIAIVKCYMFNDIDNTILVYKAHEKNIKLRKDFGAKYGVDLRSKSDAQMAEAIFRKKVQDATGYYPAKVEFIPGSSFKFQMPEWVQFSTPNLQWLKQAVIDADFVIGDTGYVQEPEAFRKLLVPIDGMSYSFGIGGLHSTEESVTYFAGSEWIIRDHDVASYYPKLILGSGISPPAIGYIFRPIYSGIVDERLAEKIKDKKGAAAEGLKIVVNGSFGKTMDPWSCLYCPQLGMQTTLSGQLALFMGIEMLAQAGFQVINANTDGIVVRALKSREDELKAVMKAWEKATSLEMETTDYSVYASRDVNNYVAVMLDGKTKTKGVFGEITLKKNPANAICGKAVSEFLAKGTSIEQTIRECSDINQFVTVRDVRGGCAKVYPERTEYLGKVARWYYANGETGEIVTAAKGHTVPRSEGAKPIMRYTGVFPEDLNYQWYIQEAIDNLTQMGISH